MPALDRFRAAVRWVALGFGHRGLVLDVGSGNSPHPRADILCDRHLFGTGHRHNSRLVRDRQVVCADVCALPFKTGAFEFVITRHVLEHIEPGLLPQAVLELTRVAKAGYIETPSAKRELLMPDPYHKTYVELSPDGVLCFSPKVGVPSPEIAKVLLKWRQRGFITAAYEELTVSLRWQRNIHYRIGAPVEIPRSLRADMAELTSVCDEAVPDVTSALRTTIKTLLRIMFRIRAGAAIGKKPPI